MDYQAAIHKQVEASRLDQNQRGGIGRYETQTTAAPPTPLMDTVGNTVALLLQQASELRERTASLATQIAGPVPPRDNAKMGPPDSLIGLLCAMSSILAESLQEAERAQRAL